MHPWKYAYSRYQGAKYRCHFGDLTELDLRIGELGHVALHHDLRLRVRRHRVQLPRLVLQPVSRRAVYYSETIAWLTTGVFVLSLGLAGHLIAAPTMPAQLRPELPERPPAECGPPRRGDGGHAGVGQVPQVGLAEVPADEGEGVLESRGGVDGRETTTAPGGLR